MWDCESVQHFTFEEAEAADEHAKGASRTNFSLALRFG
jgi:hypothetical protein